MGQTHQQYDRRGQEPHDNTATGVDAELAKVLGITDFSKAQEQEAERLLLADPYAQRVLQNLSLPRLDNQDTLGHLDSAKKVDQAHQL